MTNATPQPDAPPELTAFTDAGEYIGWARREGTQCWVVRRRGELNGRTVSSERRAKDALATMGARWLEDSRRPDDEREAVAPTTLAIAG